MTICSVFGHEPAIPEYVILTMLALTHRLFEAVTAFPWGLLDREPAGPEDRRWWREQAMAPTERLKRGRTAPGSTWARAVRRKISPAS
ncbi:MAG: hypothetical protein WB611_06080 [Stellaceae bacterium]